MEKNIKNKTVVITGGAFGIGFEIADKYLKKGAKVVIILDVNEKNGHDAMNNLNTKYGGSKAIFIKCDVTNDLETVYKKIVDTYKTVDVLVNNAGVISEKNPAKCIDINVKALIEWSLKFWNHMRKDEGGNGGTIVNLASIYGFRVAQYLSVYQASKFAVMGFTKSLGHSYNYNRTGVRLVAICPGFTETPLTAAIILTDPKQDDDFKTYLKEQKWQKVEAVGEAAVEVFECGDSGSAWLIEGGEPIKEVKLSAVV